MANELANDLYEGSAKLGTIKSYITLIIVIIIGIILVLCSMSYFFSSEKYLTIKGKVESVKCETKTVNNKPETNCVLEVSYNISDKNYKSIITTNTSTYNNNQIIDIEHLESNPNFIRIPSLSNKMVGLISSAVAIIIVAGAYYNYYLTTQSKVYASAQGAQTIFNELKQ
jgi:hypothetical protein